MSNTCWKRNTGAFFANLCVIVSNMAALAKPSIEFTALLNMVSMTSKEQLHYLLMLEDMFEKSDAQLTKFNDFAAMTQKEQLRYLLKEAKSKEDAQRIARDFMLEMKLKEEKKKKEVDPATQAELMMKKLREAHHTVS